MSSRHSGISMSILLVTSAFIASLAFFFAGQYRRYCAIAGWACIVFSLLSAVPAFIREHNFLYPSLALLSLPFLAITVERLIHDDPVVLRLSRAAAIATVTWVPFSLIPFLRDGLVAAVATGVFRLITILGLHPQMAAWDVIGQDGFAIQIILSCTGILAIAMMLGVVFSEKNLTVRQAVAGFLLVVIPVFLLNLLRVAVVFIAVYERWFDGLPDPTGTGNANFFWAHHVCAEGLAILFLLVLVWALARLIPGLGTFARALPRVYLDRIRAYVCPAPESR